jgi:hypothetical protein
MSEIDDLRKQLKTLQDKVSKQEKTSTDTKVSPGVDFKQNYVTSFTVDPREIKKTIDGVISSVMDGFGDGEEGGGTPDHLPTGIESEISHQGDHPGKDFCHTTTLRGRIDVNNLEPFQYLA